MTTPDQQDLSVSSLFDFKNHVALVTGGATGLGEMAAQAFVQNGAKVIIASRKESELKKVSRHVVSRSLFPSSNHRAQTAERINKLGPGKCEYVVADLKDKAGCDACVAEVKKKTDRLTVLINNTGATWSVRLSAPTRYRITNADLGAAHTTTSQRWAGTSSWL